MARQYTPARIEIATCACGSTHATKVECYDCSGTGDETYQCPRCNADNFSNEYCAYCVSELVEWGLPEPGSSCVRCEGFGQLYRCTACGEYKMDVFTYRQWRQETAVAA